MVNAPEMCNKCGRVQDSGIHIPEGVVGVKILGCGGGKCACGGSFVVADGGTDTNAKPYWSFARAAWTRLRELRDQPEVIARIRDAASTSIREKADDDVVLDRMNTADPDIGALLRELIDVQRKGNMPTLSQRILFWVTMLGFLLSALDRIGDKDAPESVPLHLVPPQTQQPASVEPEVGAFSPRQLRRKGRHPCTCGSRRLYKNCCGRQHKGVVR